MNLVKKFIFLVLTSWIFIIIFSYKAYSAGASLTFQDFNGCGDCWRGCGECWERLCCRKRAHEAPLPELPTRGEPKSVAPSSATASPTQKITTKLPIDLSDSKYDEGYAPEIAASLAKNIERPLPPAIPDIAKGYEDIYLRFIRGLLIYKPNEYSDVGKIVLPIAILSNPLGDTFDLSRCGDAGRYLSISTGYRKGKKSANEGKTEIWIVPKFVVEKELTTSARHLTPIMESFTGPIGIFWTWGDWEFLDCYDYLITQTLKYITSKSIYENYQNSYRQGKWPRAYNFNLILMKRPEKILEGNRFYLQF